MSSDNSYELSVQVATLLVEMRHVRDDVTEIKTALKAEVKELDARVRSLEVDREKFKARIGVVAVLAASAGSVVMFVVEKFLL